MDWDDYRPKVDALNAKAKDHFDAIRANADTLGPQWRDAKMSSVHRKFQAQSTSLKDQYVAGRNQRRAELRNQLFGLPPGATATQSSDYRDASQRAKDIPAGAVEKEIKDAVEMGDHVYAKALARRAFDDPLAHKGIDAYRQALAITTAATAPDLVKVAEQLDKLADIPTRETANGLDDQGFSIRLPMELKGYNSYTRDKMADDLEAHEAEAAQLNV